MRSLFCMILFYLLGLTSIWSQEQHFFHSQTHEKEPLGYFDVYSHQKFGFYYNAFQNKNRTTKIAHKSIGENETDTVVFVLNNKEHHRLRFISDSVEIKHIIHFKDTFLIPLPKGNENFDVYAIFKDDTLSILKVDVLPKRTELVNIVPLFDVEIDKFKIKNQLDSIFKDANVTFEVKIQHKFDLDTIYDVWNNPSENRLRYTSQMIHLRNNYLKKYPLTNKNQLLFFLTPNFNDTLIQSFMVRNKAMGFVSESYVSDLSRLIAKEFVRNYLNSEYVILEGEQRFTNGLWTQINHHPHIYSLIDDYEDVVTDNGLIAYYLFEVDSAGNIVMMNNDWLSSIRRPVKKNTFSYHIQIDNPLFKPLFYVFRKGYSLMHILVALGVTLGLSLIFKRIRLYMEHHLKLGRFWRFNTRFIEWFLIIAGIGVNFLMLDYAYRLFEQTEGEISEYAGNSLADVTEKLTTNLHPRNLDEDEIGSEVVIKKDGDYFLNREKRVLEFKVYVDDNDNVERIQFSGSSDSLKTSLLKKSQLATSHYMVFHFYCDGEEWLKDEVYNHLGVNLTDKLHLEDPPRRILLFVNGYRPTSLGRTFEESFDDIKKNGLEFPNSLNRVYNNDRYNYWHPWGRIDDKFKERINPTEVFYADGHYSVSTSNYRSLLKFTTTSTRYPDRCKDSTHHVCYKTNFLELGPLGTIKRNTYGMLATNSNKRGFHNREEGGEIAGRNLFQLLNELPNSSLNDTLYIVAHSMGFAYAQGIVKQLRGKIQFGGFYIIAPEDGKVGEVNVKEWKEIWQYGSNLKESKQDAPCLQDGVAPQSAIKGIENHRVFIPAKNYNQKGFFDSHFIGYYKWILEIEQGKKGEISQH